MKADYLATLNKELQQLASFGIHRAGLKHSDPIWMPICLTTFIDNRFSVDLQQMSAQTTTPVTAPSLSFRNLFNHFFLLHDFFHKLTKTKAKNSQFFDLQIEIYNGMKGAVSAGSKTTQIVAFGSLCAYFLKGNSIKLRFLYGFLFMYWYNHIMTLGSYLGVFCRIPSVYKKTASYYTLHPQQKNLLHDLQGFMDKERHFEQPQLVLTQLFGQQDEEKSYVENDFFSRNKEKYLPKEVIEYNSHHEKKLKYMDSFITRYVYYSFARWWTRMGQFLSLEAED